MIRTWFGCFRAQKLHFGAFRQSLVLWSTFSFGQSRLWNFGSTPPGETKWPRSTMTLDESRSCLTKIRAISETFCATVDRYPHPRSTGASTHPAQLRIILCHGPPVPAPTVDRCRGMTETVSSIVRGIIERTKVHGRLSLFPRSTGDPESSAGPNRAEPMIDRWLTHGRPVVTRPGSDPDFPKKYK